LHNIFLICFNFVVGVFSVNCSYMKAFRILLFLTGLLFETVTAQTITELMSKEKIAQNKIETITQYTHRLQNGNVDSKGYKSVETTYDKQGNSIEVVNYKPNGTVSSRHLYKYNDKDQKIEYQQFQDLPGKGFALAFRQAFTYDPKGNKLTEIGYDGRTTYRIAYTYTADGKQKDITKYTANNTIDEKWIFDHSDSKVKISIYKPAETINKFIERTIDAKGRIIDEKNMTPAGKELGRTTFKYGTGDMLLSKVEFYGGELRASYTYIYDEKNQLVEVYLTKPGANKILYSSYKYDGNGNLLEEKWYEDGATDYSRRNYKIDKMGIINEVDAFYSDYNYRVVYRYSYKFAK